jgi:putative intracellular protease/amidase
MRLALLAATTLTAALICDITLAAPAPVSTLSLPAPKAGHAKPLVVVLADNAGAETTDFVIPYGVLKDAGVADVLGVATRPGPVKLMLSMTVEADATTAQFEAQHPEGADLIVVPYIIDARNPTVIAFLKSQYGKGATVMSICAGAASVAEAGLFDGRQATSHWSRLAGLAKHYRQVTWVRDRRYVQDGRVISTAGVTASIPASLALVEAMAGRPAAEAEAARLGVTDWSAAHRTSDFTVSTADVTQALGNLLAFWSHERVETPVRDGFDEMALALRTDAWGNTLKTKVVITGSTAPVRSRHGLVLIPDAPAQAGAYVIPEHAGGGGTQLDLSLKDMDHRYGPGTTRLVALEMEYPRR